MKWLGGSSEKSGGQHRLAATELFRDLSERELRVVDAFVHVRRYLAGEIIFDEGEAGQALYVIVSGRIAICRAESWDKPVAELGENHFFGELGLLDDSPRSAQARALEETELVVLFRGDYERLMDAHARIASRIALQLARHMGLRLRRMLAASPPATR